VSLKPGVSMRWIVLDLRLNEKIDTEDVPEEGVSMSHIRGWRSHLTRLESVPDLDLLLGAQSDKSGLASSSETHDRDKHIFRTELDGQHKQKACRRWLESTSKLVSRLPTLVLCLLEGLPCWPIK
jgi:hypothetical protein